jgi:hypothetical protein
LEASYLAGLRIKGYVRPILYKSLIASKKYKRHRNTKRDWRPARELPRDHFIGRFDAPGSRSSG